MLKQYITKLPDIITDRQRTSLKFHDQIHTPISYNEATKHVKHILSIIPSAIIAGSYRRECKEINDIDVIVTQPITKVLDKLGDYIVATLALGDGKFSGIAKLNNSYRRIDIIFTTTINKPYALFYFTGDYIHNIRMRKKAKKLGYTLSQHGMKSLTSNRTIPAKTEHDIYKALDLPYLEPRDRTITEE